MTNKIFINIDFKRHWYYNFHNIVKKNNYYLYDLKG